MSTGDVITGFLQTKWKWQSSETVGQQNGVLKNINELPHHMMDYSTLSSFLMDWKDTALKLQYHKRSTIHTNSGEKGCIYQFPRLALYEKQHWHALWFSAQSYSRKRTYSERLLWCSLNQSQIRGETTDLHWPMTIQLSRMIQPANKCGCHLRFMVPIGICGNDSKTHLL